MLPFRASGAVLAGDTAPLALSADGRRVEVPAFTDETEVEIVEAIEPAHEHEDAADPAAVDPLTASDTLSVTSG